MANTLRRGKQKAGDVTMETGETLFDKGAAAITGADDAAYSTAAAPAPAPYAPTDYATANGARYASGPSTQPMYSPPPEAPAAEQTMQAYSTVAAARGPTFAAAPTPAAAAPVAPAGVPASTAAGTFAHKAREARESTATTMPGAKESATSKLSKGNKTSSSSSSYKAPKEKAKPVYATTKTDDDAAEAALAESEQDYPQKRLLAAAPAPAPEKVKSRPQHHQKPVPNGGAPGVPPGLYHQYPPGLPQAGPTGGKTNDGNWTNLHQTQPGVFLWPRPAYEEWYDDVGRRVWVHTATGTMTYNDPYF